jgi:hypothetical protein
MEGHVLGAVLKFFVLLGGLLTFSSAATADVVYLKRSELTAFALGQQIGNAAAQVAGTRQFSAYRQGNYAALDALRARLAACGNCADRDRLAADIKELQSALLREDRILCGTINSMGFSDPAVDAVARLSGIAKVCDAFNKEAQIVEAERNNRQNKEEFARRVRAGDLDAYVWMGRRTMVADRSLPLMDRINLACPYFYAGSRKGVAAATVTFAEECLFASSSSVDMKDAFDELRACAARQKHMCTLTLAGYYETTRRKDAPWPNPADDREALRLYEEAVREGEAGGSPPRVIDTTRASAAKVRARLEGPAIGANGSASQGASGVQSAPSVQAPLTPALPASPAANGSDTGVAAVPSPARPAVRDEPRLRQDAKQRRCATLLRSLERAQEMAALHPDRRMSRLNAAQTAYDRECNQP